MMFEDKNKIIYEDIGEYVPPPSLGLLIEKM